MLCHKVGIDFGILPSSELPSKEPNVKKLAIVVIALSVASPALAGDLRKDSRGVAAATAQSPVPLTAPAENPYRFAALGLVVGGGALAVYGFTHTNGAEVTSNSTGTSVSAKETKSTGVGFVGLGIAAVGGFVYMAGERKVHPEVSFGAKTAKLGVRVRW